MNTIVGMPISVGRVTRTVATGSISRTFIDLIEARESDDIGKTFVLWPGESKRTCEYGTLFMIPPVTSIWPVRLTNVDGKLVKTMFRRPKAA